MRPLTWYFRPVELREQPPVIDGADHSRTVLDISFLVIWRLRNLFLTCAEAEIVFPICGCFRHRTAVLRILRISL